MPVNPQEYNREERQASSWWSSRHHGSGGMEEAMKKSRRITLVDILLLVILIGVLVPLILRSADAAETKPYRVSLSAGSRSSTVTMRIYLPEGQSVPDDVDIVGWRLSDDKGEVFHKEFDLPPSPGERRIFSADVGERSSVHCEIILGDSIVERELTMDEP